MFPRASHRSLTVLLAAVLSHALMATTSLADPLFVPQQTIGVGTQPLSIAAADLNNGVKNLVTSSDCSNCASVWLDQTETEPSISDWNNDGVLNMNDFYIFLAEFEKGC